MINERIEDVCKDLRHGAQILLKNPGFTVVAVLALALGIGANTAIFSVVNAVPIKPLAYSDPQRVVWVTTVYEGDQITGAESYIHWKQESKTFDSMTAFGAGPLMMTDGRGERKQSILAVTQALSVNRWCWEARARRLLG